MNENEELLKNIDYLKCLSKMNTTQLKEELNHYLTLVKSLGKLYKLHYDLIKCLDTYICNGDLSISFKDELDNSLIETIYEKAYLDSLEYIIKKIKKNVTNSDAHEIYLDIVSLNFIDTSRYSYITSIYNNYFTNANKTICKIDNDDLLYDVSCSINRLYKKLKYKRNK